MVQPLWRTVWRFLKKLKIELPYDPAIPPLGIYPKKMKTLIQQLFATTWMDLKNIMLSEISQTDKYCMLSLLWGI